MAGLYRRFARVPDDSKARDGATLFGNKETKKEPKFVKSPQKHEREREWDKDKAKDKKAPVLLFADKATKESKGVFDFTETEDIHSSRFKELTNMNTFSSEDQKKEAYKFFFNRVEEKTIPVYLDDINIVNIDNEETFHRVPTLAHKLDVTVKQPGLYAMDQIGHLLKDGGKFLKRIPQSSEIDFDRIPGYKTPSNDPLLLKFARETQTKYIMSTSTISAALIQMYFMFSGFRSPDFKHLSEQYRDQPKKFMVSQRKPSTCFIKPVDKELGIYALESDNGIFVKPTSVLSDLGKVVERQLTMSPEEFEKSLVKGKIDESFLVTEDHHRFMKLNNNICLRSQIDCRYEDENGHNKVFEIKTRAAAPIRYDLGSYQDYLNYEINHMRGVHSSFEREYYDLIRGGFMKYSFQLRIGRMDGAFIAYHNTEENFGFEYVKASEIERRLFGSKEAADAAFVCCSKLLTTLLDELLKDAASENYSLMRVGYYADGVNHRLTVFSELFFDLDQWKESDLIEPTNDIRHEFDFYEKVWKDRPRKVFKYTFNLHVYVNGVKQTTSDYVIRPNDTVEIRYSLTREGKPTTSDYMYFLHEAFKLESSTISLHYIGTWLKEKNY